MGRNDVSGALDLTSARNTGLRVAEIALRLMP